MSGGGLDAGGRMGCVRVAAGRGSVAAVRAVVSVPGAGSPPTPPGSPRLGRGRAAPPSCSGGGELILGSRLGSLTQIRHDKEGESGTCAEAQAWAESGGVNSADGRICASKSRSAGLRFTQL